LLNAISPPDNVPNNIVREIATTKNSILPAPRNAKAIQTTAIDPPNSSPTKVL